MSHHAPHPRSVAKAFEESPLSPAYASDLSEMLEDIGPDLWVHGHTHTSFDYAIRRSDGADVRVVCNPRGYVGVENPTFDPALLIEVS